MREFKYDVVKLINLIKERPCLWDRTTEVYKDRTEKREAWEQVFSLIDERYDVMTPEEKKVTSEKIQTKWTNIRDTFVKTLRTRMGKAKRKYVLHQHLTFLLKVSNTPEEFPIDLYAEDISYMKTEECLEDSASSMSGHNYRKTSRNSDYVEEEPKRSKSSKDYDKSEADYLEVEECNDPRIMNEDEAFFASLLPTVVKYSEDERLEFRIQVLAVMKKIKDQRKW